MDRAKSRREADLAPLDLGLTLTKQHPSFLNSTLLGSLTAFPQWGGGARILSFFNSYGSYMSNIFRELFQFSLNQGVCGDLRRYMVRWLEWRKSQPRCSLSELEYGCPLAIHYSKVWLLRFPVMCFRLDIFSFFNFGILIIYLFI